MAKSGTLSNLHHWLISEDFTSSRQARLHRAYLGWLSLVANPLALAGFAIVVLLVVVAALAPVIAVHDPFVQDFAMALNAPSAAHWLGTDEFGRDVFSRLVFGARTTLYITILVTVIVAPIGFVIGATAGYLGGWVDVVLMRITDIFLSFPSLVLALAFSAALGPGIENAVIAIALTVWPPIARLARAETLTFRQADFVVAAELQGAGVGRILLRHIVPLCAPSIIVRLTLNMSSIILTAAGLGFLGLGAQPPMAEWGAMAASGRQYLLDAWWLTTAPGIAILTVSLAFNLLGDGLRDIMDPRNG
ncbi:ABC transporter permease [Agrobacterium pusense]|jgi:peptide/nickel transport system permease protein|uniref:ABC transporter permease n=1 Tax=Agrobacterium pusense TaxID=648995 RepID=UPI0005C84825|nr:ABC transporter permease [Agrobacterium pusense]AUC13242.1 D-ala-D-ala transporter subunit [Rhizobium sp. Y9]KIV60598.1 Dipeptide transport system permease protein DppC [Rhizobium sp. UR51a]MDP9773629.1 peptide/nickel transport system permease protein [Rhizobium sp. SORGH_AS_0755]MBP2614850.1 peptide/nickel transport system permease protein [Agrobacterium pusense]UXT92807.1 ABC transporter permease [Agrobacterium pusense]